LISNLIRSCRRSALVQYDALHRWLRARR
jgi:hypothetical protein